MRETEEYRIVLSDEHEGVARIIDMTDESRYLEVPIINQRVSGDTWIQFRPAQFNIVKQKSKVVQFEESLDITDEQRTALYEYWGSSNYYHKRHNNNIRYLKYEGKRTYRISI